MQSETSSQHNSVPTNYYVPDSSKFPIFAAFSLFLVIVGASSTINAIGNPDSKALIYPLYWSSLFLEPLYFFGFVKLSKRTMLD